MILYNWTIILSNYLCALIFREMCIITFQNATQPQKDIIEQAAQLIAQENTELASAFIQKTAVERAIPEMDKRLATVRLCCIDFFLLKRRVYRRHLGINLTLLIKWASSWQNLSSGVCDQQMGRPVWVDWSAPLLFPFCKVSYLSLLHVKFQFSSSSL